MQSLFTEPSVGDLSGQGPSGHYQKSARLIGAAERVREILGWRPSPPDQADYDECKASTRAALGEAAFAAAWAEGQAMTLEQAIEYALALDEVTTESPARSDDSMM